MGPWAGAVDRATKLVWLTAWRGGSVLSLLWVSGGARCVARVDTRLPADVQLAGPKRCQLSTLKARRGHGSWEAVLTSPVSASLPPPECPCPLPRLPTPPAPSLAVPLPPPPANPGGALGLVLERSRQLCLKRYRKPTLGPEEVQVRPGARG